MRSIGLPLLQVAPPVPSWGSRGSLAAMLDTISDVDFNRALAQAAHGVLSRERGVTMFTHGGAIPIRDKQPVTEMQAKKLKTEGAIDTRGV